MTAKRIGTQKCRCLARVWRLHFSSWNHNNLARSLFLIPSTAAFFFFPNEKIIAQRNQITCLTSQKNWNLKPVVGRLLRGTEQQKTSDEMSEIRVTAPPTPTLNFKPSAIADSSTHLLSATSQCPQQEEGNPHQSFANRASWMPGATHAAWSTQQPKMPAVTWQP